MGFTAEQAKEALKQCDGNVERAVDWLFSHPNGVEHTLNGDSSNVSGMVHCEDLMYGIFDNVFLCLQIMSSVDL
jgi:uncharacterized UBP type Zn finger protein